MRETGFPSDHTAVDLLTPGATVVVAVDPSKEVARASKGYGPGLAFFASAGFSLCSSWY